MATHSSVLAWRIPGTEEAGGLPSMGLHRVGHDSSDLAAAAVIYQCQCFKINVRKASIINYKSWIYEILVLRIKRPGCYLLSV